MQMRVPMLGSRMRAPRGRIYKGLGSIIVPPLAEARRRGGITERGTKLRTNPFIAYPAWRLGMRISTLGIKVMSLNLPPGDENRPERARMRVAHSQGRMRAHDLDSRLGSTEATNHPAQALIDSPNPSMTRQLLMAGTVVGMLVNKRAAWVKERDPRTGTVTALWPIPDHVLHVVTNQSSIIDHFEARSGAEVLAVYEPSEVCYFRLMPDLYNWADGFTPFDALTPVAEFGLSALESLTDLFDYGLLQRIYIDLKGKTLEENDADAAGKLAMQLAQVRTSKGHIPVMEDGATIESFGEGSDDKEMHNALDRAEHIIDRMFSLDAKDSASFYTEAVQPIADVIEHELERSFFSEWTDEVLYGEFSFREAMKGTPAERIEMHQKAIFSMQETPNEARIEEGKPPIEGAASELWGPLNLWTVDALDESQRRNTNGVDSGQGKSSGGGIGGTEGKGTLLSLPTGNQVGQDPTPDAPRGLGTTGRMRAPSTNRLAASWRTTRDRITDRHAEAFGRRVKAFLRGESKALNRHLTPTVRAKAEAGLPAVQELIDAIAGTDDEFARLLVAFMGQAGSEAWKAAAELVGAEAKAVDAALKGFYETRAAFVAERFMLARQEVLARLFSEAIANGQRASDLAAAIGEQYESLATHFTDSISRTEMAMATERAALASWHAGGVSQVEFIFGGGPCTTGVCQDASLGGPYDIGDTLANVGESFEGADSPPLHPSCTCFLVAYISPERAGALSQVV